MSIINIIKTVIIIFMMKTIRDKRKYDCSFGINVKMLFSTHKIISDGNSLLTKVMSSYITHYLNNAFIFWRLSKTL